MSTRPAPPSRCSRRLASLALVVFAGSAVAAGSVVAAEEPAAPPIAITLGEAEPLPATLHAFNTNMLTDIAFRGLSYDGPQLRGAVTALRPRALRFPGGTIANNYLWKEDSFSSPENDKTQWAAEQLRLFRRIGRPYDRAGFARLCAATGCEPIWVLNVYEESPASVVELLDEFDRLRLPVKRIELGNEPYWDGRSLMNVWDYMTVARPLAQAIREARPTIQIGACFGRVDPDERYAEKWNAPLAKQDWFDAIVYHEYYGGQGIALEKGEAVPTRAMLYPEAMFEEPAERLAKVAPGKPIWFTEWNVGREALKDRKNTGAELLFLGVSYASLVELRDRIPIACFHQITGGGFGTYDVEKGGGISRAASWHFFRLLGGAFAEADRLRPLTMSDDTLRGFATADGTATRLFLTNRAGTSRTITLPADMDGDLTHWMIDCPPEERLDPQTELIRSEPIGSATITLPAYSVSLIAPSGTLSRQAAATAKSGPNLFLPRPHLTLWHKPFARQQPRFTPDGQYTVNLDKLADKPLAVIKMDLSGLRLKAGGQYTLRFEVKSAGGGGVVIKTPEDGEPSAFVTTYNAFAPQQIGFTYAPAVNNGEITFVLTAETLRKGGELTFRDFNITSAE